MALRAAGAAVAALLLSGCSLLSGPTALQADDPEEITVTSPEFGQGVPIPLQYTCYGEGESPPLAWSGQPAGTRALALVMDDASFQGVPASFERRRDVSDYRRNVRRSETLLDSQS